MDQTIMIAAGMILSIAAIVAALAMVARKQTRKQYKMLEAAVSEIIETRHLQVDRIELFRDRIVAIDMSSKVLIYTKLRNGEAISDIIDLQQVHKCELVNMGPTGTTATKDVKTQEHVCEIHLVLHVTDGILFRIVMYSEVEDGALEMPELRRKALEWRDIITGIRKDQRTVA